MRIFTLALCMGLLLACNRGSSGPERHYNLTGKVVSLDKDRQTVTVDAAAIPNYMEAMTMEYPVKSKSDLEALRVGEQISATVEVKSDDSYALSDIKPQKK